MLTVGTWLHAWNGEVSVHDHISSYCPSPLATVVERVSMTSGLIVYTFTALLKFGNGI